MNIDLDNIINKKNNDLTNFLKTKEDGVFYTGHASILVRLNNKKYFGATFVYTFEKLNQQQS